MQKTQSKTLSLKTKAAVTIIILILVSTAVVQGTLRIQDPTGSTNGYWEGEKYIRNSNGKTWTATGDNLQAAIWDLNNTGGTVLIPASTFSISSTIVMHENIHIIGDGMDNTVIWKNTSGDFFQITKNSDGEEVYIKNLYLKTNGIAGKGIVINDVDGVEIENVGFKGFTDNCINLNTSYVNKISNCFFETNHGTCIYAGHSDINYRCTSTVIDHNIFDTAHNEHSDYGNYSIHLFCSSGFIISNNHFECTNATSIYLEGGGGSSISGIDIINNRFHNIGVDLDFIKIVNSSLGIRITSNHFSGASGTGKYIFCSGTAYDILVNENYLSSASNNCIEFAEQVNQGRITNNYISGSSGYSIYCLRSKNTVISGNALRLCASYGIFVLHGENCVISGNILANGSSYGIYLNDVEKNCVVSCNSVYDFSNKGIYLRDVENVTVTGNSVCNGGDQGIYLYNVNFSIISNNVLYNNDQWGVLGYGTTDYIILSSNIIRGNTAGNYSSIGSNSIIDEILP